MYHKFLQTVIIGFALLALIGQSNAMVTMPCMDTHEQPSQQMDHSQIDHSEMNHKQMNHADMGHTINSANHNSMDTNMDCCDDGGNCSMTGCSTLALFIDHQMNSQPVQHSQSIDTYSNQAITLISSSLYRPPISH